MSYSRWCTKEDVLRDLSEISGQQVNNFDDEHIVVGNRPPPPRMLDIEDDEFELRFGKCGRIPDDTSMKPDLNGISRMLREVNDSYDDYDITAPRLETSSRIIISKLNPDVEEFVPKGANNSSSTNNNSKSNPDIVDKNTHANGIKENMNNVHYNNSTLEAEDIKNMTAKLKSKISQTSKADNLHDKREKNVAIAALMRLHTTPRCANATSDVENVNTTPKLLTPQYFQESAAGARCETDDGSQTNTSNTKDDQNETISKTSIYDKEVMDDHVQKSIEKVNNWLEKPNSSVTVTKPKNQVFLGPIAFKRKSAKSPLSETRESVKSPISNHSEKYKPSQYANELSKKYMEREKERAVYEKDIWANLEDKLRERDEKIRLKSMQTSGLNIQSDEHRYDVN